MLLPILRLYAAAGLRHLRKSTRSFDKLHSSREKYQVSTYELITEWRAKVVRCLVSLFVVPHLAEADACEL